MNIKHLVVNSLQIIIVSFVSCLLVILAFSIFIDSFKMTYTPANHLSNSYYEFATKESVEHLISTLENSNEKSSVIIIKKSNDEVTGVYGVNRGYDPKVISGRGFTEDDFQNGTNTILVSTDLKNNIIEKMGKKFYFYKNTYFEVIGIYKRGSNMINEDAKAYFNLSSKISLNNNINIYYLDAQKNTNKWNETIKNRISIRKVHSVIDISIGESIKKVLSSQRISYKIIMFLLIIVLLNLINVTINWIEKRKNEVFVRRLVGATKKEILSLLSFDYLIIQTCCFIISLILIICVSKIISFAYSVSLLSISLSYTVIIFFGLISSLLMVNTYYKKNISKYKE